MLKDTAIPTIFDLTSHLKNPHTRHRKRIKELVRKIFDSFWVFLNKVNNMTVFSFGK